MGALTLGAERTTGERSLSVFARVMITRRFSMIRATQPTLAFGTGTIVMSVLDNV